MIYHANATKKGFTVDLCENIEVSYLIIFKEKGGENMWASEPMTIPTTVKRKRLDNGT